MNAEFSSLQVSVEQPRAWSRRLTITVPRERVEREREDVARRLAKRLRLPGFRQGKIPVQVLERKYGSAIEHEAVERVVGEAYKAALEREGFEPITQGSVDSVDYSPGADLVFAVEFEVRPEIELIRLGGFTIDSPAANVDDAEVERVVQRLREQEAAWAPVAGKPEPGDLVKVLITPLEEAGAEPREYEFALGEGQAVEDVEAAIATLEPGGEGEFEIRIATEEGEEPKKSRVRIQLVEAKHPELPELDDEFAKGVGDFETLEALRARITEDLRREAEAEAERAVRHQLLDRVLEANPFEVPDSMVDRYLDQVLRPRDGADPERVLEARRAARAAAEDALKRMLVIERVAAAHGLQASTEEVDTRVEEIAQRSDRPVSEVWTQLQKTGRLQALEEEITERKVFDFLKGHSTVKG